MRPDAGLDGRRRIDVEEPAQGDIARHVLEDRADADSLFFLSFNGNNRSLTLNPKHPRGKEIVRASRKTADVLLEHFGPDVIELLGFAYPRCGRSTRAWCSRASRDSARTGPTATTRATNRSRRRWQAP